MTLSSLQSLAWTNLDDDGTAYPAAAVTGALNEAQRFFCLLTLCLETTTTFALTAGVAWYRISSQISDWLVARRILNSQGRRLRPATLRELDALDTHWQYALGTPARYVAKGFDLLAITAQPPAPDQLTVTYAQAPAPLVHPGDVPQIPDASAFALSNYAAYVLRQPEGGQEFSKSLGYFNDFLDEAGRIQEIVAARNVDLGYERPPFELKNFDRSRLIAWRNAA